MISKKFISPEIENNTIEELSKQLLKANTELKKLQEEREMMFANISHDLRAPMFCIVMTSKTEYSRSTSSRLVLTEGGESRSSSA